MSADTGTLRAAATILHARADAATPGPWTDDYGAVRAADQLLVAEAHTNDRQLIEVMHPDVARALAEWLTAEADEQERLGDPEAPNVTPAGAHAYRVADAVLAAAGAS